MFHGPRSTRDLSIILIFCRFTRNEQPKYSPWRRPRLLTSYGFSLLWSKVEEKMREKLSNSSHSSAWSWCKQTDLKHFRESLNSIFHLSCIKNESKSVKSWWEVKIRLIYQEKCAKNFQWWDFPREIWKYVKLDKLWLIVFQWKIVEMRRWVHESHVNWKSQKYLPLRKINKLIQIQSKFESDLLFFFLKFKI